MGRAAISIRSAEITFSHILVAVERLIRVFGRAVITALLLLNYHLSLQIVCRLNLLGVTRVPEWSQRPVVWFPDY